MANSWIFLLVYRYYVSLSKSRAILLTQQTILT